jgi:hypothetical protein
MYQTCGKFEKNIRYGERGEGSLKLIIFLVILFLAVWAGLNYIPVAYKAQTLKQEIDTTVTQASILPNATKNPVVWTTEQLKKLAPDFGMPDDAVIDVKPLKNSPGIEVQVKFKKPVSLLPFYTYQYEFDYTAKTSGFLTK